MLHATTGATADAPPLCPWCGSGRIRFADTANHTARHAAFLDDIQPWTCVDCGGWGEADELLRPDSEDALADLGAYDTEETAA